MDEQFQIAEGIPIEAPGLQPLIDLPTRWRSGPANVRVRAASAYAIEFGSFTNPDPSPHNPWTGIAASARPHPTPRHPRPAPTHGAPRPQT
ncbi:hypothetical protein J7I97_08500 [Streptomyces sp. ISL-87]|uniref:hypothetical protein n=1 Tax=Streptomyces sp. ISL-87 TaxID=2819188 RepID=UPI001BEC5CB8|nr:hypothetical protein [Streptomyces sp. ISL-87]MBT2608329.1 hypothetical protein [Streptomyces sp. ISL-87]